MPNELGLGRAYVAGELDLDGDLFDVVMAFRDAKPEVASAGRAWKVLPTAVKAAKRIGALGRPTASAAGGGTAARLAPLPAARCTRRSGTTTTSATTSIAWCSGRR